MVREVDGAPLFQDSDGDCWTGHGWSGVSVRRTQSHCARSHPLMRPPASHPHPSQQHETPAHPHPTLSHPHSQDVPPTGLSHSTFTHPPPQPTLVHALHPAPDLSPTTHPHPSLAHPPPVLTHIPHQHPAYPSPHPTLTHQHHTFTGLPVGHTVIQLSAQPAQPCPQPQGPPTPFIPQYYVAGN